MATTRIGILLLASLLAAPAFAEPPSDLQQALEAAARGFNGRVGVGVQEGDRLVGLRLDERFSLQSVMKLLVGMAVLDAVDRRGWRLETRVTIHKSDLSLFVQPIAREVTTAGFTTTIGDLVRRAVVQSDSAAADILIARLGGPQAVQAFLDRSGVRGMRFDRDERHLQTEIAGLRWQPAFVEPSVLEAAMAAVPERQREAAFKRYLNDPRDTSTPRAMAELLHRLGTGKLLSPASTRFLMAVLDDTVTFPDRLKAGVAPGWQLGHKTGTSSSWKGLNGTTNDVGVLRSPDGRVIGIAVFVAETREPPEARAALMARVARAVTAHR